MKQRLIKGLFDVLDMAMCAFFAWLTIRAIRQGEDVYAALGVALTLGYALNPIDRRVKESA